MRKSTLVLTVIALLLLVGTAYLWYRAGVVMRQPNIAIEFPIRLTDGSVLEIPLSVPVRRACQAEIQYRKTASTDIEKALHGLSGEAALMLNGAIFARSRMPTHTISGESGFIGTILFAFKSKGEGRYILSLRVDHVPADLQNVKGRVKIEDDYHHNKDGIGLTVLSRALAVCTVLTMIVLICFWIRDIRKGTSMVS